MSANILSEFGNRFPFLTKKRGKKRGKKNTPGLPRSHLKCLRSSEHDASFGASVPPDPAPVLFVASGVPDCSPRISRSSSETSSSSSPSHSLSCLTQILQWRHLLVTSSQSILRNRAVLLLLGYLTTKSTCSPHVHTQLHTSTQASFFCDLEIGFFSNKKKKKEKRKFRFSSPVLLH